MEKLASFLQKHEVGIVENLHKLFDRLHDIITVQNTGHEIIWANKAALESAGVSSVEDLRGRPCYSIWHGQNQPCGSCAVRNTLESEKYCELESGEHGEKVYLKRAYPFKNKDGKMKGVVEISLDITEKKQAEAQLKFQAEHDMLTGLPNMNLFESYFAELITSRPGEKITILTLDLDKFSKINNVLGYEKGDQLLKFIAGVIKTHLSPDDMLARTGGDIFGIMIPNRDSLSTVNKIREDLNTLSLQHHDIYLSGSLGASVYPADGDNLKTLLRKADTALKEAKKMGGNNYRYFNQSMVTPTYAHLKLLRDLKQALDQKNELILHYQPQIETLTGKISGVEALVRWKHPEKGLLFPDSFIPLAEESGLVQRLDYRVLERACLQLKDWENRGIADLTVSVNISARQFTRNDFHQIVRGVVEKTGVNPARLDLEITEHTAIQNMDFTIEMLERLRQIGVLLSLDDFGTGYSSLYYLQQMKVNYLKIDKSFINEPADKNRELVKSIILLAHNLNLQVIAEGVETKESEQFLREEGCDFIQGYYYYRPLPAADVEEILPL